jgi:xanthine dehydrogenase accessory factor|tara:strand:- start:12162 stop:13289 length:1128 start_codon:yes stop_codon:yes gene_type:complete
MKDVFEAAIEEIRNNRKFVISTVTRTIGSTPQKTGAKLLVREDGSGVGTLGGGCVEGDIWFASSEKIKRKEDAEVRPYELNEDLAAKDGLVCGGTMHFLIDPIDNKLEFEFYLDEIKKAYNGDKPVALIQMLDSDSKLEIGKKILVREDGTKTTNLVDDNFDEKVIKEARQLMALGKNKTLQMEGKTIYIEAFTTPPKLLIAGGGHVSNAISKLAKPLGFELNIFDDRKEFANEERFPEADEVKVASYSEGFKKFNVNANTFIIIATRGHRQDDAATKAALDTNASYVGLLGSKRKTILIIEKLLFEGIDEDSFGKLRAPVGLNIGARTPEEIAISIISEILSFRLGGDQKSMMLDKKYIDKIRSKISKTSNITN